MSSGAREAMVEFYRETASVSNTGRLDALKWNDRAG